MRPHLIPVLPLIEGETLTGFVSRSATLHETTPRDYCSDLGMRWPYLCSGHDDQIERLAWLIGQSPEKLREITSGKVEVGRFKFGQTVATFGSLRRTAVRFCPKCVTNALLNAGPHGVFQMQEWAITSLQTCPHHNCFFMTLPAAKYAHINYDFVARILENIDAVQSASLCPEIATQTAFERYIRERIWRGPKDDWLEELDLTQIHRLCLNLGAALKGLKMKAMMTLDGPQERSLCQLGFKYFNAGPDGFSSALKRIHGQSTTARPYFSTDMGPFYQWLREFYDDPTLEPIVDLTCTHIFETYPTPMGQEVFNRVAPKQIWLTMNEARKKTGFGVMFLKKFLGYMNGLDETEAVLRTDVHADELAKVQAYWKTLLNLETAASLLGISSGQVKLLQDCGVLDMIRITSTLRYVSKDQVTKLLERLEKLPTELPNRSVFTLRTFCCLRQVSIVRLIELWVLGKLDGKLCRGKGQGLGAIEVDWLLLSDKGVVKLIKDLTPAEAARYLKVNIIVIRRLRDAGYFEVKSVRNPDTNHLKQFITQRSISGFERKYITLGQMAHAQNVRPIHLARKLDRENLTPISCSAGPVRVYLRQAI